MEAVGWRSCGVRTGGQHIGIREMASGQLIVIISKIIIYASLTIVKTFIGGHRRLRTSDRRKRAANAAVVEGGAAHGGVAPTSRRSGLQQTQRRLRVKHNAAGDGNATQGKSGRPNGDGDQSPHSSSCGGGVPLLAAQSTAALEI